MPLSQTGGLCVLRLLQQTHSHQAETRDDVGLGWDCNKVHSTIRSSALSSRGSKELAQPGLHALILVACVVVYPHCSSTILLALAQSLLGSLDIFEALPTQQEGARVLSAGGMAAEAAVRLPAVRQAGWVTGKTGQVWQWQMALAEGTS